MQFNNDKRGRTFFRKHLERRAARLVAEVAERIYEFQVPSVGPIDFQRPFWSGYFRANWNVSIGSMDNSVFGKRKSWPPPAWHADMIQLDRAKNALGGMASGKEDFDQSVYVTNPVYYGPMLLHGTLMRKGGGSIPARDFINLAREMIRENLGDIIHSVVSKERRNLLS